MFLLAGEQRYFEETLPVSELKDLLDSGSMSSARGQSDRIKGLKWLLAMISKGTDVSRFFPDVIRNIMTVNFELKKLAYMYVLHYGDHDENSRSTALLSINAFQRDLSDENELIRGLALRTLTSIRVRDIVEVQALAITTCARDSSPYVRKIAANAVCKLKIQSQFEDNVLASLLLDNSPSVMGSAAAAILQVCPNRFDLVHAAFERICLVLHEVDEFGQIALLKLLSRYVRYAFVSPALISEDDFQINADFGRVKTSGTNSNIPSQFSLPQQRKRKLPTRQELDSFLNDEKVEEEEDEEVQQEVPTKPPVSIASKSPSPLSSSTITPSILHTNHKRLLQLSLSLLKSRNSGVVMAAASASWYCGQRSTYALKQVSQALVRLVKSQGREVGYCALKSILPLVQERPHLFFVEDFFVSEQDLRVVKTLKLELIACLTRESTLDLVLKEMEMYVRDKDQEFAAEAVRTVGLVIARLKGNQVDTVAQNCLLGLIALHEFGFPRVLEAASLVARDVFVKILPVHRQKLIPVLHTLLSTGFDRYYREEEEDKMRNLSKGKCSLIWLARVFSDVCMEDSIRILHVLAQNFCEESNDVKLETLNLAMHLQTSQVEVSKYVFALGDTDSHFDVRDWSRFLQRHGPFKTDVQESALLEGREKKESKFEIDSLSFILNRPVNGYIPLPEWAETPRVFKPVISHQQQRSVEKRKQPLALLSSSSSSSSSSGTTTEDSSSGEEGSSSEEEEEVVVVLPKPVSIPSLPPPILLPAVSSLIISEPTPKAASLNVPEKFVKEYRLVLSHVRGKGLQVEVCFSRQPSSIPGWTMVWLRISNKHVDTVFSNIYLEESPPSMVRSHFRALAVLPVNAFQDELSVQLNFQGHWRSPIKCVLVSDETGRLEFDVKAPPGELLIPRQETEFEKRQKQLGGMHELIQSIEFSHPVRKSVDEMKTLVFRVGHFQLIDFHENNGLDLLDLDKENSAQFAAQRNDESQSLVLLQVTWNEKKGTVQLNCANALAGQALMDALLSTLVL